MRKLINFEIEAKENWIAMRQFEKIKQVKKK